MTHWQQSASGRAGAAGLGHGAHLRRLTALGLAEGQTVPFPYRQQDLADAVGLSLVHTNKMLARLRLDGLADWAGGRLTVPDVQRLGRRR